MEHALARPRFTQGGVQLGGGGKLLHAAQQVVLGRRHWQLSRPVPRQRIPWRQPNQVGELVSVRGRRALRAVGPGGAWRPEPRPPPALAVFAQVQRVEKCSEPFGLRARRDNA